MRKITLLTSAMLLFAFCALAQGPGGQGRGGQAPPEGRGGGPGGPPPAPRAPAKVLLAHEWDARPISYSLDVIKVIDTKCLGCHSPSSRGQNSKKKLQWAQLQEMSAAEAKVKLDTIKWVLDENEMPPARMVERDPSAALTPEEAAILKAWVNEMLAKVQP